MSKNTMITVIVVIVLIILAIVWVIARGHGATTTSTSTPTPTASMAMESMSTATPDTAHAVSSSSVTIQNFAFSPSATTVKKGTKVTWTNQDSTSHTVTADDKTKANIDSPTLTQGSSYSFTFNTVGTFSYHCAIHPTMMGTVTVTE